MKKFKSFISILLCLCLITIGAFTTAADSKPVVTLTNVTAFAGEEITINVDIAQNPGIMAMAFCVTYDKDALSYNGYQRGYLSSCTVKNHGDKGYVSFVNIESSDKSTNGTIVSFSFTVKDDAKPGIYPIKLANSDPEKYEYNLQNIFSNSKLDNVVPSVINGSLTVDETCEEAGHKFGNWSVVSPSDCTHTGIKTRKCVRCDFVEDDVIPISHDFEYDWTIDKVATPDQDGEMSRHCKNCDAVTDKITFSYEEVGGDEPDEDETPSDTPSDDDSSSNGDTSTDNSDTNSSSNISSDNNSDTNTNTSSNASSGNNANTEKPNINNVIGEKVPQQEAEKLENYQPPKNDDNTSSNISSTTDTLDEISSESSSVNADTENVSSTDDKTDEDGSIFDTTGGIVMLVLGGVLILGIIALCVFIIIRRKK